MSGAERRGGLAHIVGERRTTKRGEAGPGWSTETTGTERKESGGGGAAREEEAGEGSGEAGEHGGGRGGEVGARRDGSKGIHQGRMEHGDDGARETRERRSVDARVGGGPGPWPPGLGSSLGFSFFAF